MNFIVHNKKELAEKISLNVKMVDKNSLISSLSNLKLELVDSTLIITAFDGNNCAISKMDVENILGSNRSILVDSSSLKNIIDRLSTSDDNPIEFRLIEDSSEMLIKSKKRLKMKVLLDTTDFNIVPKVADFNDFKKVSFERDVLLESVNKLSKYASVNNSKPILEAINFIVDEKSCDVVCLDGYRLGLNMFECSSEDKFKISVNAYKLKSILKDIPTNEDNLIELKTDGRYTLIQSGDTSVFIREIEGSVAPYKTLLDKKFDYEFLIDVKEMISIVKTSMMVTAKDNKIVKLNVSPNESLIRFSSRGEIIVDFEDEMNVLFENSVDEDLEIAFNSSYLLDILMSINEERARIFMKSSVTPVYVDHEINDKNKYLVLPVRLGSR